MLFIFDSGNLEKYLTSRKKGKGWGKQKRRKGGRKREGREGTREGVLAEGSVTKSNLGRTGFILVYTSTS